MNVKEYINSGIVESYVLGLATDAERQEFEQLCAVHREVAEARDAFERSLEDALMNDAQAPPAFVKAKVMEAVRPAVADSGTEEEVRETPVRRMNVWKLAAAACFVGLLGIGYWAYTTNERNKELAARQSSAESQLAQATVELDSLRRAKDVMTDPSVRVAAMKGTANAPQALTTVFWDSTSKDVYLLVNNLPQPAADRQYQLWALLDGKPIDLGMLEVRERRLLVKMKNVQNAQAFAITLEPTGGSVNPTLEAMYVLGNL